MLSDSINDDHAPRKEPDPAGSKVLRLFGTFAILNDHGEAVTTKSAQARAVLMALAMAPNNRLLRTTLASWFCGGDRSKFRQVLDKARRALGPSSEALGASVEECWLVPELLPSDMGQLLSYCADQNPPEPPDIQGPFDPISPRLLSRSESGDGHLEWELWLQERTEVLRAEMRAAISKRLDALAERHAPGQGAKLAVLLMRVCASEEPPAICAIRYAVAIGQMPLAARLRQMLEAAQAQNDDVPSDEFRAEMARLGVPAPRMAKGPRPPASGNTQEIDLAEGPPERPSIGVCLLRNGSVDPQYDYVGLALAESLIDGLARQRWFPVRAVDLPGTYKPSGVAFGPDTLDAYLVTGSYVISGAQDALQVQLNIRLTRGAEPAALATEAFSGSYADLRDLSGAVVDRIVATVANGVLSAEETRAAQTSTHVSSSETGDAWNLIAKARHLFWKTSRDNNSSARALLDEALVLAPDSIPGLVTAAFVRLLDVWSFWSADPEADLAGALTLAQRAVRAADRDAWAFFTLGTVKGACGQLAEAVSLLDRALELHPAFAPALGERARINLFLGKLEEAQDGALAARRMSPLDPHATLWLHTLGMSALLRGDFEAAHDWGTQARAARGFWYQNLLLMAAAQHRLNLPVAARANVEKAMRLAPGFNRAGYRYSHPFANPEHEKAFFSALQPYLA
jgi:tetratricopeptide (TPR) repeat protein